MKIFGKIALFLCFCVFIAPGILFAQTEEELLDQLLLGDGGEEVTTENEDDLLVENKSPFSLSGFGEFESGVSMGEDSFEDNSFFKNHGRIKLKPSYEIGSIRAYGDIDFFTNSGGSGETRDSGSLECVEAYIEGSGAILWKIGKQRFNWGVGDSYQPTDLFDRPDLRDSFMRDNDDRYTGVYAVSLKYLMGDYAVEAAVRPVTEKALGPVGFYAVETETIHTASGNLSTRYQDSNVITDLDKVSAGIRFGGTSGIVDWHLMYYSGMNRDLLYRSTIRSESSDLYLDLQPVYKRMNAVGSDLCIPLSKFNVRLEGIFSPDMPALSSITNSDLAAGLTSIGAGASSADLQSIKHREYFNYTAGFDINLWGDDGTVYLEWMQARYLNEDNVEPILLTDILVLKAEDYLFNQFLKLSASSLIRIRDKKPGVTLKGEAEYDFKNGMTMAVGTYAFISNGDEYIDMIDDKDLAYLEMKFEF
ncbi:hypothetical protein [Marispirochaeta aestuarii]|uniref:hypothetical protein n=1 Tax=Marispirochaeta aestuarii TaxID=1963862 RepID=UPI0029C6435D|nr:hypothetical protein [Marispirochaeta aestuarii]